MNNRAPLQLEILRALRRFQLHPGVAIADDGVRLVLNCIPCGLIRAELSPCSETAFPAALHNLIAYGYVEETEMHIRDLLFEVPPKTPAVPPATLGKIPTPWCWYRNAAGTRVRVRRIGSMLRV